MFKLKSKTKLDNHEVADCIALYHLPTVTLESNKTALFLSTFCNENNIIRNICYASTIKIIFHLCSCL